MGLSPCNALCVLHLQPQHLYGPPSTPVAIITLYVSSEYREPFLGVFGKDIYRFTRANLNEFAHLCNRYLPMRLRHMLQFTLTYFSMTSQIWKRTIARLNAPYFNEVFCDHFLQLCTILIYKIKTFNCDL